MSNVPVELLPATKTRVSSEAISLCGGWSSTWPVGPGRPSPGRAGLLGLLTLCALCLVLLSGHLQAEEKPAAALPVKGLYCNIDNSYFFGSRDISEGKAGEAIDQYVDCMARAGVTVLLCCTNAQRTNYRSRVWDARWDGYDPAGPDDQPFLAPVPRNELAGFRKIVDSTRRVFEQGVDYPARMIARCRQDGISPWISLRMNDCHNNDIPGHPSHGTFWRENPQFARKNAPGYFSKCLDYAHLEVRDFYKSLIVETLDRYDIDGLELDFMREVYLFSAGKESEGMPILTAWMREIHKLVQDAAARRGHAIHLGVRVPSHPETARGLGLDAITWAKEGLIDMLVVTPRWATLEFDMPLEEWRSLLGDAKVALAGGLEILYRSCPSGPATPVSPELAKGAATAVLSRGADAVYLFNYFAPPTTWPESAYPKTLKTLGSLDALLMESRTFAITYRDVTAPGEKYRVPLPAKGKEITFPMRIGPLPSERGRSELSVEFAPIQGQPIADATMYVNGKACEVCGGAALANGRRLTTVNVPLATLAGVEVHEIKIVAKNEPASYQVERVEMALREPTK